MLNRFVALSATLAVASSCPAQNEIADMEAYTEIVHDTKVEIPLVPIPVGTDGFPETFEMGSPPDEAGRKTDEEPRVEVRVEPFWIGKFEITWDTFDAFRAEYTRQMDAALRQAKTEPAQWADAVSFPTPLYEQDAAPILSGLGTTGGYPVANITQFAARQFTKWLSRRTGHFYRLPTEAEWEYAARAGTTTAFSFGDAPEELGEYAWYFDNSAYDDFEDGHPDFGAGYRRIGTKRANPWGIHDVHGNVAEWVIDRYVADGYEPLGEAAIPWRDAVRWPTDTFPCVVRGGSWDSDAEGCRSAARLASDRAWQARDPQLPKSVWWFTDAFHIGFRIVRPLVTPSEEEQLRFWESADEGTLEILGEGGKEVRAPISPPTPDSSQR